MSSTSVELFRAYLTRVRELSATLPDDRARRLVDELGQHLTQAQRQGQLDEWAAHLVLEKLGTPEQLVAATASSPLVAGQPVWFHPKPTLRLEKSVLLLVGLGLLLFWLLPVSLAMMVAGAIGTACSQVWTARQKMMGIGLTCSFVPGLLALRLVVGGGALPQALGQVLGLVILLWAVGALWSYWVLIRSLRA